MIDAIQVQEILEQARLNGDSSIYEIVKLAHATGYKVALTDVVRKLEELLPREQAV